MFSFNRAMRETPRLSLSQRCLTASWKFPMIVFAIVGKLLKMSGRRRWKVVSQHFIKFLIMGALSSLLKSRSPEAPWKTPERRTVALYVAQNRPPFSRGAPHTSEVCTAFLAALFAAAARWSSSCVSNDCSTSSMVWWTASSSWSLSVCRFLATKNCIILRCCVLDSGPLPSSDAQRLNEVRSRLRLLRKTLQSCSLPASVSLRQCA